MLPTREEMKIAFAERHGIEMQEKLQKTTIAICGLGGLGSNLAICLARFGIGRLILIDYDKVEVSNLHRQQYKASQVGEEKTKAMRNNVYEISPYVEVESYQVKLQEDNIDFYIKEADIVCEAFDGAEDKAMLANYVLEHYPQKYLIAASGMAGVFSANLIQSRKVMDHFIICGDGSSDVKENGGLFASRVMLCAAHQAHAVLRILSGMIEI